MKYVYIKHTYYLVYFSQSWDAGDEVGWPYGSAMYL